MNDTTSTPDGAAPTLAANVRLIIGKHTMCGFDGLSDGDFFGHINGQTYRVRNSSYGITLRSVGNGLGETLPGFVDLPDYHSFVRAVNDAQQ